MPDLVLLHKDGREAGRLSLREGRLDVVADDPRVHDLARQPLPWLHDEEGERTVRSLAQPGTEEHLRVLMFEVRRLGLEARHPA